MIEFTATVRETITVCGDDESVTNILPIIAVNETYFDTACAKAKQQALDQNIHRRIHAVTLGKYRDSAKCYYEGWKSVDREFK